MACGDSRLIGSGPALKIALGSATSASELRNSERLTGDGSRLDHPHSNEGTSWPIGEPMETGCWTGVAWSAGSIRAGRTIGVEALLIAAAPELLAACKAVLVYLTEVGELDAEKVRLAIDRAEGNVTAKDRS